MHWASAKHLPIEGEAKSGRMLSWKRGVDSNKDNDGVDDATTKTRMDEHDIKDNDDK